MSDVRYLRLTTTETFNFEPSAIRAAFGDPPEGVPYEDWIIGLFHDHNGSPYGVGLFRSDADGDSGIELLPEGWEE